jgi:opacity protein-like surface antigen
MRKYLLATVAALVIATPAAARDGSPYVGIEGGILFPRDTHVHVTSSDSEVDGAAFSINYKNGYDVDAIAGYDLGMFRLEGELGYKRTKIESLGGIDLADENVTGHTAVLSGMLNGLVDFSAGGNLGVYAGGGLGRARVKFSSEGDSAKDNAWAWQLIAGVHAPISANIDAGLKYRYFQTGRLNFDDDGILGTATTLHGKFRSHSLLASLVYNFGGVAVAPPAPVVAPAPAPEAPATQACPDGSVIAVTDTCPAPAAPPPPPAATSGERGR